jgi:hypothetical protein
MKVKALTLLNIILATILATSLFLMSTGNMSNSKLANGTPEYDPWKDINDDGMIEMMDYFELGQVYMTSGDPTKNVYVMNPSYERATVWLDIPWSNHTATGSWTYTPAGYGHTGGYSKLFIHLWVPDINPKPPGFMNTTVYVSGIAWNSSNEFASYEHFEPNRCNVTIYSSSQLGYADVSTSYSSSVGEFEIKAETILWMTFNVTSIMESGSVNLDIHTYVAKE